MKHPRHLLKQGLSCAIAVVLAATLSAGWTAGAATAYPGGKLSVVTEPGDVSSYVHYYVDKEEKSASDMAWDDNGHTGKAVSLSGNGEYLEIEYNQLQMHTMTFAGWFYWRGAGRGQDAASLYTQRLFTLSRTDSIWLSVMPHAKDASRADENGKILDGIYMGFAFDKTKLEFWNPAAPDKESYGLPMNEWHHVAMTMDGQKLRLYIDGRLWFEKALLKGVDELRSNTLTIGSGRWGEPTLNALIDDMAVYNVALDADKIAMLSAGVDPLAEGASLPPSTSPSLPQAPTESQQTDIPSDQGVNAPFGLPVWSLFLIGGVLIVFIGLSVVLSVYRPAPSEDSPKSGTGQGKSGKGGGKP